MRLLSTVDGHLEWFDHNSPTLPEYAILSHVWDKENGEQSYQDLCQLPPGSGPSSAHPRLDPRLSPKIRGACICAHNLGYLWIWIDSCCIDKTSSAELSEAIASMYAWYAGSEICLAYLQDVPIDEMERFDDSVWFLRGWTLQELIAPRKLMFLAEEWEWIDTRANLARRVAQITQVDLEVLLLPANLEKISIGERLTWASQRQTTRPEDRAYSLMGVLGVNVPIMYGEGERAFLRLQEEILKRTPDRSIFCWGLHSTEFYGHGLLAPRPEAFLRELNSLNVHPIVNLPWREIPAAAEAMMTDMLSKKWHKKIWRRSAPLRGYTPEFTITPFGVRARVPIIRKKGDENTMHACAVIVLGVRRLTDNIGITLHRVSVAIDGPPHYAVGYPPGIHPTSPIAGQMSLRLFVTGTGSNIQAAAGLLGLNKDLVLKWEEIYVITTQQLPTVRAGPGGRSILHSSHVPRTSVEFVIPPWIMARAGCPDLQLLPHGSAVLHKNESPPGYPWITITPPKDGEPDETDGLLSFTSTSDQAIDEVPSTAGRDISQLVIWVTTTWGRDGPVRTVDRMSLGITVGHPITVRPHSVVSIGPAAPVSAVASCHRAGVTAWVEYLRLAKRDTLRVFVERAQDTVSSEERREPSPSSGTEKSVGHDHHITSE